MISMEKIRLGNGKIKIHKSIPILTWGRALRKLIIHAVQRKILVFFETEVSLTQTQTFYKLELYLVLIR